MKHLAIPRTTMLQLMLLSLMLVTTTASDTFSLPQESKSEPSYILLGVSGGLQDGFPDHSKMDYTSETEVVKSIFVGRGLVRGYKAYLDVMQPTWRQYIDKSQESDHNKVLINSNVLVSGCYHHANEYWMYLVDSRQFVTILMNEPRFLSITPDLGLVDLTSLHTSPAIKHVARHEIFKQNKTHIENVAFPIVTAAWYNPTSMILSPIVSTDEDGTEITNFPYSLAKWIGMDDPPQQEKDDVLVDGAETTSVPGYWDALRRTIRTAEANPLSAKQALANGPPFECAKKARLGVSPEMARINYPFSRQEIQQMMEEGGYNIDFESGSMVHNEEEEKGNPTPATATISTFGSANVN